MSAIPEYSRDFIADAPPGLPSVGVIRLYADSATGKLTCVDSDGNPAFAASGPSLPITIPNLTDFIHNAAGNTLATTDSEGNISFSGYVGPTFVSAVGFGVDGEFLILGNPTLFLSPSAKDNSLRIATTEYVDNASPAWFNVKAYGAKGDTKKVVDGVGSATLSTISSATAGWTSADIGKIIYATYTPTGAAAISACLITNVVGTTVTFAGPPIGAYTGLQVCWGTDDTAALQAATTAALSASYAPGYNSGLFSNPSGNVYLPAGGYMVSTPPFNFKSSNLSNTAAGLIGDGAERSVVFVRNDFSAAGISANDGFILNGYGIGGTYKGWSVDFNSYLFSLTGIFPVLFHTQDCVIENVRVDNFANGTGTFAFFFNGTTATHCSNVYAVANAVTNGAGGAYFLGAAMDVYSVYLSNTAQNLQVQNVTGGATNQGLVFHGGLIDEDGSSIAPTVIIASKVTFIGTTHYGGSPMCVDVDPTSIARFIACNIGPFSTNDGSAINVQTGGVAYASQCLVRAKGSGKVCVANSGTFYDLGGNTFTPTSSATEFSGNKFLGPIALSTKGTPNGTQNALNLVAGTGITLSDDGDGNVTIGLA